MRCKFNCAELLSCLQNLDKVVVTKNNPSILACVLFEINGNTLTLRSTDKEITLITSLQLVEADGDFRFAIESKQMIEILKTIPDQPITFDINTSKLEIKLNYQNGYMIFQAQNADEFPMLPEPDTDITSFTVNGAVLARAMTDSVVAAAEDEGRKVMQGVFFDITPGEFNVVASDGRMLVLSQIKCDTKGLTNNFIMPQKPISAISSVLMSADQDIIVSTSTQGNATFNVGTYTMYCRLLTDPFPNYHKVIPTSNDRKITIDRASLLGALRRAMVVADISTSLVKLSFDTDRLVVSAENRNYAMAAEETVLCQYDGTPIKIGFKGDNLIELLLRISTEMVTIELSDPSRAGIIKPAQQDERLETLMLVMPMLITS